MSRWTAQSELRITLPSLRAIVFVLVMVIAVGAVVLVSVIEVQTHPGPTKLAVIDDTKVTAWISAIFTALGAVGTAGALWLGAFAFRRQSLDQHRSQAKAVTVSQIDVEDPDSGKRISTMRNVRARIQNDSAYPIYAVRLAVMEHSGRPTREFVSDIVPNGNFDFATKSPPDSIVFADFKDSAGVEWRRYSNGDLEELPRGSVYRLGLSHATAGLTPVEPDAS